MAVLDIDDAAGVKTQKELGEVTEAEYYHCDVSSVGEIQEIFEKVVKDFGGADVLVSNAGIPVRYPIEEITEERWQKFTSIIMLHFSFWSSY